MIGADGTRPARVVVLLATFRGEAHLRAQLDSLAGQTTSPDRIIARDDGSDDGTRTVLEDFARAHPGLIDVIEDRAGRNLGFVGNFFALLAHVPDEARYVFFCDQDDVWLPAKIARAVARLDAVAPATAPALVFSRLCIVGPELAPRGLSPMPREPGFGHALCENAVTGCTMCANGTLARLVRDNPPEPARLVAHDWWFYLVAAGLGRVVYDPEPTILYRQHAANVEGAAVGRLAVILGRLRGLRSGKWSRKRPWDMLVEFHRIHGRSLQPEWRALLEDYALQRRGRLMACARILVGHARRDAFLDRCVLLLTALLRTRSRMPRDNG